MLVPPERLAEAEEVLARARTGEQIEGIETFRWTKDGRRIDVCLTVSPVWNDAGEIVATSAIVRDITERKRAASALTETEAILRVAFEDAPIGMVLALPDAKPLQVNRALCYMLGYTADELLTTPFWTFTHPDDLGPNMALIQQALRGEIETYELEKRYLHRDGHIVWAQLHGSLVRDAEGAPSYFISQILDITERKASEMALAEAHRQTGQVLERITDGFIALDREWRFTYVNEAAERIIGQTRDELLGTTIWERFPWAKAMPAYSAFHRAMAEGVVQSVEVYYEPHHAWFTAHAYPSPEGLSVFFRDVTATRQLIQETRDSEEKYRSLVDQLPVVVYLLAADEAQTPLYFSPHLEVLMGYRPEEAMAWRATQHSIEAVSIRMTGHASPPRMPAWSRRGSRSGWSTGMRVKMVITSGSRMSACPSMTWTGRSWPGKGCFWTSPSGLRPKRPTPGWPRSSSRPRMAFSVAPSTGSF